MNYFDTHVHLWDLSNMINSWVIKSNNPNLMRDILPENYLANFPDTTHIFSIEASDNDKTLIEVEWIKKLKELFKGKLQIYHYAYINLLQNTSDFEVDLQKFLQYEHVIGFRQILSYSNESIYSPCSNDFTLYKLNLERLQQNLSVLARYNYIFNCQMYPQQLIKAWQYIAESKVSCLIDHCALPLITNKKNIEVWLEVLKLYNNLGTIYKLSGFDLNEGYKNLHFIVDKMCNVVPSSNLVFGSNYPLGLENNNPETLSNFFEANCSDIAEKIFFTNAINIVKKRFTVST